MDHETKIGNIDGIQLPHMSIELNIHQIIIEDGVLPAKALALFLVQAYYRKIVADIERVGKSPIKEGRAGNQDRQTALLHAKWFATKRSLELPDIVQATTVHLLEDAGKTGWHHQIGENDNIGELLASMMEGTPENNSTFWDYQYVAETLLPLMRSLKFNQDVIDVTTMGISRIRQMLPAARHLLKEHEEGRTNKTNLKKELKWLVDVALDNTKNTDEKKKVLDKYRGKQIIEEIVGYVYMLEKNRSLLTIEVTDDEQRMIEMALRNRVSFRLSDISSLLKTLSANKTE